MKDLLNKGQSAAPLVIITAIVMQGVTWTTDYFLKSPEKTDARMEVLDKRISLQGQVLSTLCNDYGQTISRLDQNIQNIGTSLRVPVVVGKANNDPCGDSKTLSKLE